MDVNERSETFVSKLQLKDKYVYIKVLWKQDESDLFYITIFDRDYSWSGRFPNDIAKRFRERENIDENEEVYSLNVRECLTGKDDNYTYDFTTSFESGGSETASFSWKKRFRGINVLHGSLTVHRDANRETKDSLIDILLQKNKDLNNDIIGINNKTDKLEGELQKCQGELEKYVDIKTSLETILYGKFVQLLNAKKRRIQLLEDNLLNFEEPNSIMMGSELD